MAEIDILIAFDTATISAIQSPSQDPNNPTAVGAGSIFMITQQGNVVTGQGGNELQVQADTGDIIRWRERSLSLDVDDRVLLYNFQDSGGGLISPPGPFQIQINDPLPGTPPNVLPPTTQTIQEYYWQTNVLLKGTDTYHFSFVIIARNGTTVGYFMWDPFIIINP